MVINLRPRKGTDCGATTWSCEGCSLYALLLGNAHKLTARKPHESAARTVVRSCGKSVSKHTRVYYLLAMITAIFVDCPSSNTCIIEFENLARVVDNIWWRFRSGSKRATHSTMCFLQDHRKKERKALAYLR